MTIQLKHLMLVLGGTLLGIGLLLGFLPAKADGASCGSAYRPNDHDAQVSDLTNAMIGLPVGEATTRCSDATSSRRTPALALTIPGAVLLTIGICLAPATTKEPHLIP